MKRRDFLKKGVYTSFVVVSAPVVFNSCSNDDENNTEPKNDEEEKENSNQVDLSSSDFENLKTEGEFAYYKDFIIINTGSGFMALSKACTHQGCDVNYNPDTQKLPCPCHGSVFNKDGSVENGPAETPLTVYDVTKDGDILTIE